VTRRAESSCSWIRRIGWCRRGAGSRARRDRAASRPDRARSRSSSCPTGTERCFASRIAICRTWRRSNRTRMVGITTSSGSPSRRPRMPDDVTLHALYEQRLLRLLSRNKQLADRTLRLLPTKLAGFAGDAVVAHRELVRLTPPLRTRTVHVGPAAPAGDLLRWYHEAERRFGVAWRVLAAVNFVESAFGKLRSASAAGAQGPMQFTRSSWRTYGLGGNVHDPHDAILGAANYLRAAGAWGNIRRALYAYNPSRLYVDAVLRYARRIGADIHAYYAFYSWQ